MEFCVLLVLDPGQLWTQSIDKDLWTYLKGKYPSAGGKLIFPVLERVPGLFSESAILVHTRMLYASHIQNVNELEN